MDGWMHGRMDGREVDGWMNIYICRYVGKVKNI